MDSGTCIRVAVPRIMPTMQVCLLMCSQKLGGVPLKGLAVGVKGGSAKRVPSEEVPAGAALRGLAEEALQCRKESSVPVRHSAQREVQATEIQCSKLTAGL